MKRNFSGVAWQIPLFSGLAVSGILALNLDLAFAQVIPDETLGNESSVVNAINSQQNRIDGGATRGANLFHSFGEFNVREGRGVYFANPNGIENIFSRVTGNNRSEILGTLGVNGAANLFLINPNGILFGENAVLDVQGSFAATTADGIKFGDRSSFSASQPEQSTLVSVAPSAFFFNAVAHKIGNIINRSSANGSGLRVNSGKNITLVGGDVVFDGGLLIAPGGRVEVGGLTAGEIGINSDDSLSFPNDVTKADVSFTNNSFVSVSLTGSGNISINARNLEFSNSFLLAGLVQGLDSPGVPVGAITLNATEKVRIEGNQPIFASTILNNAGDIVINAGTLEGIGNFNINSTTFGEIKSGDISITARDKIALVGTANNTIVPTTFISSIPNPSAIGNAGNITINTPLLSLSNISIGSGSNGQGDAGNIQINTTDSIFLNNSFITASSLGGGNAGELTIESKNGSVSFDATRVGSFADLRNSTSGNMTIKGRSLSFTNGSQLFADNNGQKNAGNINVEASKDVNVSGSSQIGSNTGGQGDAGNVNVSAESLSIKSGGIISASTFGEGNGGNVTINVSDIISLDGISNGSNSAIASNVIGETGKGNGGEVKMTTKNLSVTNGGTIGAVTTGAGNGGNILINALDSISLDGISNIGPSAIVSAAGGTGKKNAGGIEMTTKKLSVNNEAEINAKNLVEGNAGNINIYSDQVFLDRGAKISNVNTGKGNAGNILIKASDIFSAANVSLIGSNIGQINGTAAEGKVGNIQIEAKNVSLTGGAQLQAAFLPNTRGESGNVSIKATDSISFDGFNSGIATKVLPGAIANGSNIKLEANSISIANGAGLNASSEGIGNAGNIEISADSLTLDNNSSILASNTPSADISNTLSGGNLSLKIADNLILRNSDISTQASSNANGGNIDIAASAVIAFADSDIFAFTQAGRGGNITLNTPAYFASSFNSASSGIKPNLSNNFFSNNDRADVNATGALSGVVSLPDVSFIQNSLADLPDNAINTENLIANSCVVRSRRQEGRFIITGAEGLPESPTDNSISPYPTGEVRKIPSRNRSWQKGDSIVEPQGVYELENGRAIASRECS